MPEKIPNQTRYPIIFIGVILFIIGLDLVACTSQPALPTPVPCSRDGLIEAIHDANADSDLTEIDLEPNCTIIFDAHHNNDGGAGRNALPLIISPIKIIGNGAKLIRGQTSDQFRFFWITSAGNLRLEDLILENGYGLGANGSGGGGAIYNEAGILALNGVYLVANNGYNGGAVYTTGSLIIDDNTEFRANFAPNNGGAIYIAGTAGIPISISDTTFTENRTLGVNAGSGGAIYIESTDGALLGISDSTFENNESKMDGGAIYNADSGISANLTDLTFLENNAGKDGGAIYMEDGSLILHHSLLAFNRAWNQQSSSHDQRGGAVFLETGFHQITLTKFYENRAEYGGGAIFVNSGSVFIDSVHIYAGITNRTWLGDTYSVDAFGGGIFNNGTLTIENSFIENCQSEYGGGLINRGDAILTNVIMANNAGEERGGHIYNGGNIDLNFVTLFNGDSDQGGNIYVYGGSAEIKNSIFDRPYLYTSCEIQAGSFNTQGENIDPTGDCPGFSIQEEPELFRFFGLLLVELKQGSPALDAASDCTDVNGNPVTSDQRGVSRPQPSGGSCDLGAVEMEDLPGPPPPEPQILPRLSAPENLTCREGDSTEYLAAGYLLAGESAEVIGQNTEGTWLVINNPDWEGICWLFRASVNLDGDLETTPLLTAPPLLPTKQAPGNGSTLTCSGYLSPDDCEAAGGTYKLLENPPCKCP